MRRIQRALTLFGVLCSANLFAGAQSAAPAQQFLDQWGKTWEAHDVDGIMKLYADDCVTVNRFGVVANGKDEIRRATAWLHNGPFHTSHFGTPKLLNQRRLAPGLLAFQASWKNPSGRPNAAEDEMVLTVVLKDLGAEGWLAEEVDMHTVAPLAPGVDSAQSVPAALPEMESAHR